MQPFHQSGLVPQGKQAGSIMLARIAGGGLVRTLHSSFTPVIEFMVCNTQETLTAGADTGGGTSASKRDGFSSENNSLLGPPGQLRLALRKSCDQYECLSNLQARVSGKREIWMEIWFGIASEFSFVPSVLYNVLRQYWPIYLPSAI